MTLSTLFFILLVLGILVGLFGYFFVLKLTSRFNPSYEGEDTEFNCPPVSIIISCYNEERFIATKINSILRKEEWILGSELIVVSGHSTDATHEILMQYEQDPRVRFVCTTKRMSKIESVNLAVSLSKHNILVFSDVRQRMKIGSIKKLVRHFDNDEIGTVAATLKDTKNQFRASVCRRLFNYFALQRSKKGSCLNVYGALYAQRKTVFREIPTDLLFDDLFVVVSTIKQGKRLVQEKEAVIYDINFNSYYGPERIMRLARGLLLFLFNYRDFIFSMPKPILLRFLAYKYLKLAMPFGLIVTAILLFVFLSPGFWVPLALVSAVFCLALLFPEFGRGIRLFLRVNWFFMVATINFIFFNERSTNWSKLKLTHESAAGLL